MLLVRLPYNGVSNKVGNGGGSVEPQVEALSPATPLQHVDLLDPDLVLILLALGTGYGMIRWLLLDRQWVLISCQHLDRFCRLTMRSLQILLKSGLVLNEA